VTNPTNTPLPPKKSKPGAAALVGLAMGAAILVAVRPDEGGRRLDVYLDSASIPTSCTGIIGDEVTRRWKLYGKNARFTDAECDTLEHAYVAKQTRQMAGCTPVAVLDTITWGEWLAYAHWSFNTGTGAFCNSTLHRRLIAGDHAGACKAMGNWTFITVRGQHVNCRDPKWTCRGIPIRRDNEVAMCLDAL
jgi:lysozyme